MTRGATISIAALLAFLAPQRVGDRVQTEWSPSTLSDVRQAGADEGWWQSVTAQLEREEYCATANPQGLQAPNRAQNVRTQFSARGIEVVPRMNPEGDAAAAWRFAWETVSFGRPGALHAVEAASPEPNGSRVTYRRPEFDEWYDNTREGLEQGFTIHERPSGDGPLVVTGQLGGVLRAQLSHGEDAIDLFDEHGARVLRYAELHVWDANGDELQSRLGLDGVEMAILVEDDGAAYPLTIDPLLTSPAWSAESDQASSRFARVVATAGDVNGDGYSDVIVGADQYDNGETNEGRAYVYHGSATGLSTTPAWTAEGNQANALFGFSVATAGDVNGDGFSDVIVGALYFDNEQTDEGRAFVYLGSASGLSPTAAWTAESEQASAQFGWSVATAGDVNGDGFSDVIVGANQFDTRGRAVVYHGSASGLSPTEAWAGAGTEAFDHFGISVSTAGDVNGDGFSDVIVGSIGYSNGQLDEGRALVYHGSPGGLAATAAWTAESGQASANFGWSVSTAGDTNGDGYSEVIVGAIQYGNVEASEGRAYVYNGSATGLFAAPAWTAEPDQAFASFGGSVATAGDVNGDGFADVIVGASSFDHGQTNEGRAFVYRGSAGGLSTTAAWTGESDQGGAQLGVAVATAGDVNGDGFSDVIVGAFCYDNGSTDEGRAIVYHGSGESLSTTAAWTAESGEYLSYFGYAVATAGDVNGDWYSDVIVGARYYDNGQAGEGRAFVYHGAAGGLSTTAAWTAESNLPDAEFGHSVATAGDVNGDGFSDVIVGASEFSNGESSEGRAFAYYGSAAGLATTAAWTAESNQADAEFGRSVATAGDVNGDGFSDVIVGASSYDNNQSQEGRAFAYYGSAAGLATTAAWTVESNQVGAFLGHSVATAGDVNGDGFSDVIVGAVGYDNGQTDEGRAFVYNGSAAGLSTSAAWTAEGDQGSAHFAYSVATAGDVNGDGYSDVIIGAWQFVNDEGRAFVHHGSASGLSTTADWTAESAQSAAGYGVSAATAGDVNGDGFSDVIVGAYRYDSGQTDEGRAFVHHGSVSGLGAIVTWTAESNQADAMFGASVATAGDVNGDGYSDVIVGAFLYDNAPADEGRAFVYYGNGGDGLDRIPQQARMDHSRIEVLGLTDDPNQFRLRILGRTPAGRGRVRIEGEVQPFGTPFQGGGYIFHEQLEDTGAPGPNGSSVLLAKRPGLLPGTLYHWRVRTASDSPFFPHSPWFTLASNGSAEADLRAASASTGIADASPVAGPVWLAPSAPNPFSVTTQLAYTLPDRGPVRLAVYDVSGREVAVLTDEIQTSGNYATTWNGRSASGRRLASGVYFARLEFGGRVESRKVVLAR